MVHFLWFLPGTERHRSGYEFLYPADAPRTLYSVCGRTGQPGNRIIAQNDKLRALLADVPEISFNKIPDGYRHVRHQYVQHFDGSAFGKNRDDLLDLLTGKYGIRSIVQYYPLYRYPLFQKLGAGEFDYPVLESWWDNSFSVPMWCGMDDEVLNIIADSVRSAVADLKK